jgi:DNA-binding protein H-NS
MKKIDLNSMSINELWSLHEETTTVLSSRMLAQKLKLEQWLVKLGALDDPDIHPKFRNPEPPHQTWSGRGRQPQWFRKLLADGQSEDHLRIAK